MNKFCRPRPLSRPVSLAFYGSGTGWAALKANELRVATVPHKGAGLQTYTRI
jgi:hypothetical protein